MTKALFDGGFGVVFVGLLAGLIAGALRMTRVMAVLAVVLLALYLAVAATPMLDVAVRPWARVDSLPPRVDAIVALSSGVNADTSLTASGTERLLAAIELYRAGKADRLIVTGETDDLSGRRIASAPGQDRLLHIGGVTSGFLRVDSVTSTRDEAVRVARALDPAKTRAIAVVTSPLHTRRACATFEAVGFTVYCVAAREIDRVTRHPDSPGDRLAAFSAYLHERVGMVVYRRRGWIAR